MNLSKHCFSKEGVKTYLFLQYTKSHKKTESVFQNHTFFIKSKTFFVSDLSKELMAWCKPVLGKQGYYTDRIWIFLSFLRNTPLLWHSWFLYLLKICISSLVGLQIFHRLLKKFQCLVLTFMKSSYWTWMYCLFKKLNDSYFGKIYCMMYNMLWG